MEKSQIGQYTTEEILGQGGMGTVYLATDGDGNQVAIKALHEGESNSEMLVRFKREGEALRQLNHPNIVNMLDAFEVNGKYYLVMEYVRGGDLEQLLETEKQLSVNRILEIALDLADALTRSHRLDIIHRDIKPANVLLAEDGTPRLTDFGVAQYQRDTGLTQEGAIVGTIPYLSPEGCQGKTLDVRSDIWSFGVLLYEMLTGELPFPGDNLMAIITGILTDPIPDLETLRPDAPDGLVDLVYRMLAKTAEGRIPSVRLVGAELEGLLKGFAITPSQPGMPEESIFKETPTQKKSNLPEQAVRFVGREKELGEIATLLAQPDIRLLTILGPGGMGKSRLAIETASRIAGQFERGVHFVALAPLSSPDQIVSATADVLGFQFGKDSPAETQLKNYLANKNLLLVIDNIEHLIAGARILSDWLAAAPDLKIIVTSRASLNIQTERVLEIKGMLSPETETDTVFEDFEAVELFITYARRTRPGYALVEENKAAVVKICRLVGGMPLGIELAAGWIRTLPPQEIAEELAGDMDFLSSSMSDLPARQRSMRAVFEYSWKLLNNAERDVFKILCLFPAGFKREAAKAIAGANMRMLSTLTEQSLIQRDPQGRFRVHELMRQFGEEKLKTNQAQYVTAMQGYWGYYVELLASFEIDMNNGHLLIIIDQIMDEVENIILGWNWGVGQRDFEGIEKAYFSLFETLEIKAKIELGYQPIESTLTALEANTADRIQYQDLGWSLSADKILIIQSQGKKYEAQSQPEIEALVDEIIAQGQFEKTQIRYAWLFTQRSSDRYLDDGIMWCEKLIEMFETAEKRYQLGTFLNDVSGMYFGVIDDRKLAIKYIERSQAINDELNPWLMGAGSFALGQDARYRGEFEKATEYYLESLNAGQKIGNNITSSLVLMYLGRNYSWLGELEKAKTSLAESYQLIKEANDKRILFSWLFIASEMDIYLGEFDHSQKKIEEKSKIEKDPVEYLASSVTIGKLAYYQGDYEKAYASFLWGHEEYKKKSTYPPSIWSFLIPYLGKATLRIGKFDEAMTYFKEGLQYTLEKEMWPITMQILTGLAMLLSETGKLEEAVAVAEIPAVHKATTYFERQIVNNFLEKLAADLPPETFAAAKAHGGKRTPQDVYDQYFGEAF